MALYIPHSIFHLARLLYVRQETFGPYYISVFCACLKPNTGHPGRRLAAKLIPHLIAQADDKSGAK